MRISTKILLSIPSVLTFSYILYYMYPTEFHWLVPTMKAYYIQTVFLYCLTIIQQLILIKKLLKFKNIDKTKKLNWTIVLLLFSSIASLIFIWNQFDEFQELEKNYSQQNEFEN